MPRPSPEPVGGRDGAVRLSDATRLGLPRHELSSPRWSRPAPGIRLHHSLDPSDPDNRLSALVLSLPAWAVLGGWASLRWQGVQALDGRSGAGGRVLEPVLVHVGPRRHLRPRPGVLVDRSSIVADDLVRVRGHWVTTPVRAVFDEACRRGVEEGLVAGDAAWRAGVTSGPEVGQYAAARARARGVPAARLVGGLMSPWTRSLPESRLRYVWVVAAGLPAPQVNPTLVDAGGVVVGEPDLLDVEAATAGEYDGAYHRELDQHTADNVREEGFEDLNLVVVRATSVDLWPQRPRLVERIRRRRELGMSRDRSRDAWGWRPRGGFA